MYEFGTTREQIADVAVASRRWAARNPRAFVQRPLTREDVITSRMLSSPLTVRDACLVTDGGAAIVVTSAERALDLQHPPAFVLGVGEAHWHRQISQMPDLTTTAAVDSGGRAFAMAGLQPDDVDVVELYDAFTINVILFLEDLGFCKKGEGGDYVQDGGIAPGGNLPVNTNGGGLSYTHPGMYGLFLMTEAVRQLRGDAPAQIPNAEVALVHGNGGYLSSQVSAIFGTRSTV
jgi:acetyl-CoA acetyltransferase